MTYKVRQIQRYGWVPDLPDQRDKVYTADPAICAALPSSADLRDGMPPIFNQGSLGSCTANATAAQCWFLDQTDPQEPSRLFIYYNTRYLEGTTGHDSGGQIRDSIKAVVSWGFAPETSWPYDTSQFTRLPPQSVYKEARKELVSLFARIAQTPSQIKGALVQGLPVNFGFTVYESFEGTEVASTGIVPMPDYREQSVGGHAVLIVGYDDSQQTYIVRNSWGEGWGDQGYFYMPYDYIHDHNLAADFWIIKAVP